MGEGHGASARHGQQAARFRGGESSHTDPPLLNPPEYPLSQWRPASAADLERKWNFPKFTLVHDCVLKVTFDLTDTLNYQNALSRIPVDLFRTRKFYCSISNFLKLRLFSAVNLLSVTQRFF